MDIDEPILDEAAEDPSGGAGNSNGDAAQDMSICSGDFYSHDEFDFSSDKDQEEDLVDGFVDLAISRPFDVHKLRESISEGSKILDDLLGKECVLVVGKTGTGKSSLIQALAGKKFVSTHHKTDDVSGKIVFDALDPLPEFTIGHGKASKTRFINYIKLTSTVKESERGVPSKKDLFVLDQPCFEDTEGPEVDIATSAMLSRVAARVRSLRFVVLINIVSLKEDRGVAVKGILKLVHAFVEDFETSKFSFMFLFTHTNEIAVDQSCDEMLAAREVLEYEINANLQATKDVDIVQVLDFISKCLKRDYPMVGLFHPVLSDASRLKASIRKLKPVSGQYLAANCGLTHTSKLKLTGELGKLFVELKAALGSATTDLGRARDILQTFREVVPAVQVTEARQMMDGVLSVFQTFISHHQNIIQEETRKGIDTNHQFSSVNVANIHQSLDFLSELKDDFPKLIDVQDIYNNMGNMLDGVLKHLESELPTNLSNACHYLAKLFTWSEGFPAMAYYYNNALESVNSTLSSSISHLGLLEGPEHLEYMTHDSIGKVVMALDLLEPIAVQSNEATLHCETFRLASSAHEKAMASLLSALNLWQTQNLSASAEDKQNLFVIVERAKTLRSLDKCLNQSGAFSRLQETARAAQLHLLDDGSLLVDDACTRTEKLDYSDIDEARKWLLFLSEVSQAYESVGTAVWKKALVPYLRLLSSFKTLLREKSAELSRLSKEAMTNGVLDGKLVGQALKQFLSYRFFDEVLSPQDRFVTNCSIVSAAAFRTRLNTVARLLQNCLEGQDWLGGDSSELFHPIEQTLREQREFVFMGEVLHDQDFAAALAATNIKVNSYIDSIAPKAMRACSAWENAVRIGNSRAIRHSTAILCHSIQVLELVHQLDGARGSAHAAIKAMVQEVTNAFSMKAKAIVGADFKYESKAKCLLTLMDILDASAHYPDFVPELDFKIMKDQTLQAVRDHADRIHAMLVETSDWDVAESELVKLECAVILDSYTACEASRQVKALSALIDQKKSAVDGLVDGMITSQDYKGLAEFLLPSAKTKDQIQKKKFDTCVSRILSSLCQLVEDAESRLGILSPSDEDLKELSHSMEALEDAHRHLGDFFDMKMAQKHKSLRIALNKKARNFASKMEGAAQRYDYVQLGVTRTLLSGLSKQLKHYFNKQTTTKVNESLALYDKVGETNRNEVNELISDFKASEKKNTGNLAMVMLRSLRLASQSSSPELPDMVVLYEDMRQFLSRSLKDKFESLKDHVEGTESFDEGVRVLKEVEADFKKGLASHISSPELIEEIRNQRRLWSESQSKVHRLFLQKTITEDLVKEWKSRLERSDPERIIGRIFPWGQSSFHSLRRTATSRVEEIIGSAENAMSCGEYTSLHEFIDLLRMMERHLDCYIPRARKGAQALEDAACSAFRNICTETKESMLYESRRGEFRDSYTSYRQIVTAMPFVAKSFENQREFGAINQLVHETLKRDINKLNEWKETFDFHALKKQIDHLRTFGSFVADYVTLLYGHVRNSDLENDEWLSKTFQLCQKHFYHGRNYAQINLFALLDAPPSATKQEINKAFRAKSKLTHPDRAKAHKARRQGDKGAMFRLINDTKDALMPGAPERRVDESAFSTFIRDIPVEVRKLTKTFLEEQRYDEVAKLLFHIKELRLVEKFVLPHLQSSETVAEVFDFVKDHVEQVKSRVHSAWVDRRYQDLNLCLADLKLMEQSFISYPKVFSIDWKGVIYESIEQEIVSLGQKARTCLHSKSHAETHMDDFRRCFIDMGKVLIELAQFKEFTRARMNEVLEECLCHEWGHEYLFKFGQGLQRADSDSSEEENLVSQMVLSEFKHFQEVLTMVWNEETAQKPVEDSVNAIRGSGVVVDSILLLKSYQLYEGEYQSLLGQFLHPEGKIEELVKRVRDLGTRIRPGTCDANWSGSTRRELPVLVAGIFAVFTFF
mmetsp:Transcript_10353/g.23038  ORF Transcript_10353/g.23038 Transcript_10353/m.23038 type:complete len:1945 (+) Transcript_10353:264-6098(+)